MALEIRQVQRLAQQLVMTPQLQQAIKLLQLSRVELEDLISQELQENPALEEASPEEQESEETPELVEEQPKPEPEVTREIRAQDDPVALDWQDYLETHSNAIHGSLTEGALRDEEDAPPSWETLLAKKTSLEEHLLWQLHMSRMTEAERAIGHQIIGNLDERGYLAMTLEEIRDAVEQAGRTVTLEEIEAVLKKIQLFDPVGVAARDLRECLLVQLENLGLAESLAARIVTGHLQQLESKRYDKLARELGVTIEEIVAAAHLITSLEPKPARGFDTEEVRTIIPDVSVEKIGDEYVIFLRDEGLPRLRVSALYRRLASQGGELAGQAREYLKKKVQAATELVKSIHWRQQTLYRVTQSIFKFQREFLDHGVSHLRPMVLKDVAQDISMHESTVSRATANKYVHTPQGVFELKFFFQSGLRVGNGEDVAAETVKNKIRAMISAEDPRRPYSDQYIARLLNQEDIGIARRTVAKYREAMGILPSSKRRQPHLLK
ncbi:MAG TPA: RNA polymerase factor sigma-54 [Candidatus Acidoferrales bacterium]|nr:RNA polymerase factor sigma-54 [Candidatus Acidoferrales bacterium]